MKNKKDRFPYWPFISEIRRRLIVCLLVFLFGFGLGFFGFRQIINFFLSCFQLEATRIVITSPFQVLSLAVNIGLLAGLLFSLPVLVYQLVGFVKPALKTEERKLIWPFLAAGFGLFIWGFGLGFFLMRWVILGLSQTFLGHNVSNFWDIGTFLSQIMLTAFLIGLAHEFPLVLVLLVKWGLVEKKNLKKKRPVVVAGIFVFAALLPPTDAFSLILIALLLWGLYELTLVWIGGDSKGGE